MELNDKLNLEPLDFDDTIVVTDTDNRAPKGITSCLKLDSETLIKLESEITDYIRECMNDPSRTSLIDKLEEDEMSVRGIFDKRIEKPWSSSSEIVATLTGSHCRIIANAIARTFFITPYFVTVGIANDDAKNILQDFMNEKARSDFEYEKMILKMSKVATETPAAILHPEWIYETRKEIGTEVFKTVEGFTSKYPDAKSAGLSASEYTSKLTQVVKDIKAKGYHTCEYEFDKVIKDSPKISVIHPADFIMHPFNALEVKLAKLVGHLIYDTFDSCSRLERAGVYLKGSSLKLKNYYIASDIKDDTIEDVQEQEKGIEESSITLENYKSKIYRIVKGRIRLDIAEDGDERDYEFAYALDEECLLRIARARTYSSERPYFFAEIDTNTKSIWGNSIPEMVRNPQATISTILRQLIDSNTIANVPTFKANSLEKEWFERTYQDLKFKPGKIWWLKNPGSFEQFRIQPIDAKSYLHVLQYLNQDCETLDGGNRALAGQPLSSDPEAPGVKQAMMIQQSNFMINQYIKSLSIGLEQAIEYLRSLYDQNLEYGDAITLQGKNTTSDVPFIANVTKDMIPLLDPSLKISIRPQRVDDNMTQRLANLRQDFEMIMSVPSVNQNPFSQRMMVKNYLQMRDMYTEDEINKILTPPEEIAKELLSAVQDLQTADAATQKQNQMLMQQQADAKAQDDMVIQQLLEQEQQMGIQAQQLQTGQAQSQPQPEQNQ